MRVPREWRSLSQLVGTMGDEVGDWLSTWSCVDRPSCELSGPVTESTICDLTAEVRGSVGVNPRRLEDEGAFLTIFSWNKQWCRCDVDVVGWSSRVGG